MFDILVYLFENYVHADACPEPAQLARKLTAEDLEDKQQRNHQDLRRAAHPPRHRAGHTARAGPSLGLARKLSC